MRIWCWGGGGDACGGFVVRGGGGFGGRFEGEADAGVVG